MKMNINALTSEQVESLVNSNWLRLNTVVSDAKDLVVTVAKSDEAQQVLTAVKKHAVAAAVNSWNATKEGAIVSAVASAAASVYTTKQVAEKTALVADVTAKASKKLASWILAQ